MARKSAMETHLERHGGPRDKAIDRAFTLINEIESLGCRFSIEPETGKLQISPASLLTPEIIERLKADKADVKDLIERRIRRQSKSGERDNPGDNPEDNQGDNPLANQQAENLIKPNIGGPPTQSPCHAPMFTNVDIETPKTQLPCQNPPDQKPPERSSFSPAYIPTSETLSEVSRVIADFLYISETPERTEWVSELREIFSSLGNQILPELETRYEIIPVSGFVQCTRDHLLAFKVDNVLLSELLHVRRPELERITGKKIRIDLDADYRNAGPFPVRQPAPRYKGLPRISASVYYTREGQFRVEQLRRRRMERDHLAAVKMFEQENLR